MVPARVVPGKRPTKAAGADLYCSQINSWLTISRREPRGGSVLAGGVLRLPTRHRATWSTYHDITLVSRIQNSLHFPGNCAFRSKATTHSGPRATTDSVGWRPLFRWQGDPLVAGSRKGGRDARKAQPGQQRISAVVSTPSGRMPKRQKILPGGDTQSGSGTAEVGSDGELLLGPRCPHSPRTHPAMVFLISFQSAFQSILGLGCGSASSK